MTKQEYEENERGKKIEYRVIISVGRRDVIEVPCHTKDYPSK